MHMPKMRRGKLKPGRLAVYIFMILVVAFTSMPLIYLISTAFKPIDELFVFPPVFITRRPTLDNFKELFTALTSSTVPFTRYLFNSLFVTTCQVFGSLLVCSMAAFAITKLKMPFAKAIFNVIVASLMIAPPASAIINYIIINKLGWINTYWALIIPKLATPYYFFLLKQCFQDLPNELIEAARVDGCVHWQIYTKIVVPLSAPALATVVVFSFVGSWNDFYTALIYINDQALKTLPLALQMLQGGAGQVARQGAFGAAALLTTAPTIIIFVCLQSKVVKTMAYSGIK